MSDAKQKLERLEYFIPATIKKTLLDLAEEDIRSYTQELMWLIREEAARRKQAQGAKKQKATRSGSQGAEEMERLECRVPAATKQALLQLVREDKETGRLNQTEEVIWLIESEAARRNKKKVKAN